MSLENPSIKFNDEEAIFRMDFEGSDYVMERMTKLYLSMRFHLTDEEA